MLGSSGGLREVPYLICPVNLSTLSAALVIADSEVGPVHLVPGLLQQAEGSKYFPNVMRGEETQIFGARQADSSHFLAVLPGTHCKWVLA